MDTPSPISSAYALLEKAFSDHSDAIFRYCWFRLGDREIAKDVAQDVFMRTWDYLTKGNTIDNLRAFLYTVARNLIINARNKKRPISLEATLEEHPDHEPSTDSRAAGYIKMDIDRALKKLEKINPSYAEVIILRYIDDMAVKDIAAVLGLTENVVSVRIHRARAALNEIVSPPS